jgi:magnesium and cobalt transporter
LSNNFLKKLFGAKSDDDEPLADLLEDSEERISENDQKMIRNIINLSEISVREVMVPRIDVIMIDNASEFEEILELVSSKGHSRLPVFGENEDNILGILHSKDLLHCMLKPDTFELARIIRKPLFIPESKIINELLVEMREKKIHMAIVVNEYGGVSGIVCLEDIIEKIVGEIQDEFDNEVEPIVKISENRYIINARVTLEEVNEALGTDFQEEEVDTLGGLIYLIFSKIPVKNEKMQYKNFIFTINSITGRRIRNIEMEILPGA